MDHAFGEALQGFMQYAIGPSFVLVVGWLINRKIGHKVTEVAKTAETQAEKVGAAIQAKLGDPNGHGTLAAMNEDVLERLEGLAEKMGEVVGHLERVDQRTQRIGDRQGEIHDKVDRLSDRLRKVETNLTDS